MAMRRKVTGSQSSPATGKAILQLECGHQMVVDIVQDPPLKSMMYDEWVVCELCPADVGGEPQEI